MKLFLATNQKRKLNQHLKMALMDAQRFYNKIHAMLLKIAPGASAISRHHHVSLLLNQLHFLRKFISVISNHNIFRIKRLTLILQ